MHDKFDMAKKNTSTQSSSDSQNIRDHYAEFRKQLLHRRNEVLRQYMHERAQFDKQVLDSPGDAGDASVVDSSADYYLQLADNDRRELAELNDALMRMQRGTFGICETCEIEIDVARLEKLPQARRCIDCQSLSESRTRSANVNFAPKL
jgi:DnaK suppressor protein